MRFTTPFAMVGLWIGCCGSSQAQELNTPENAQEQEEAVLEGLPDNTIVAFQTGPDVGPSYAGGMILDNNLLYLTGATYGSLKDPSSSHASPDSSCFFGIMSLGDLEWQQVERYGHRHACSTLSLTDYEGKDAPIVVGSTEETAQEFTAKQAGFALELAVNGGNSNKIDLSGYTMLDRSNVVYPVAVVTQDEQVWVTSMTSTGTKVSPDFEKVSNKDFPNLTTGGVQKYGSRFTVQVEKYILKRSEGRTGESEETLALDWQTNLNDHAVMESFFATGMVLVGNDDLVIVGNIKGPTNGDMDGVMIKVGSKDGSLATNANGQSSVAVFASDSERDDWIMNTCLDPNDKEHFYIVGATKGRHDAFVSKTEDDLTVHAVFGKIKLDDLTAVWTKQYSVQHASGRTDKEAAAAALGCVVIPGGDEPLMYVAGVVENSATIQYREGQEDNVSAGGDDIFVSMVSTYDGQTRWLTQVGSNGDDRLARGGGVSVDTKTKNAVVFGDTNGSFFRSREEQGESHSDLFVMALDYRDGSHVPPVQGAPPPSSTSTDAPQEWFSPSSSKTKNTQLRKLVGRIFWILGVCIVGVLIAYSCSCNVLYTRRKAERRKTLEQETSSLVMYLKDFDVDDIDLQRSPPGGWHVIYLNKLAQGVNRMEKKKASRWHEMHERVYSSSDDQSSSHNIDDDDLDHDERSRLTHSSIVKDSLFMDT